MIDFDEFCTLMQNFSSDNMEQEIREAFKLFDSDGSGKISTDEIRQVGQHAKLAGSENSKLNFTISTSMVAIAFSEL